MVTEWETFPLLWAAASSPGCAHRMASIRTLLEDMAPTGTCSAATASEALERLLVGAEDDLALERDIEAHVAPVSDPMRVVYFRFRDEACRIHPGSYDDPIATLDALAVLEHLDEYLVLLVGYGFSDLLDVALLGMDAQLRCLSPLWHRDASPTSDAPVALTDEEVRVASTLLSGRGADISSRPDWLTRCRDQDRAELALAAQAMLDDVRVGFSLPFGGRDVLIPAGFMVPVADRLVRAHLAVVLDHNDLDEHLERLARRELFELLLELPVGLTCPDPERDPATVHIGTRHSVTFHLTPGSVEPRDGNVDVYVSLLPAVPYERRDPPSVAIAQLRRLLQLARLNELASFFEALRDEPLLPQARSVVDLYEAWSRASSLAPDVVGEVIGSFPRQSWLSSAAWEPIDAVLATWGLPLSRRWGARTLDDAEALEATLTMGMPPDLLLMRTAPPFGVFVKVAPDAEDLRFLLMVADALRLRASDAPLRDLIEVVGGQDGLEVHLEYIADLNAETTAPSDALFGIGYSAARPTPDSPALLSLVFDDHLMFAFATEPEAVHEALGESLVRAAQMYTADYTLSVDKFCQAWKDTPPLLVAALTTTPSGAAELLPPLLDARPDVAARIAGAASLRHGIAAGILRDQDAISFVTGVYCPALFAEIDARIAQFDHDTLVRFTMAQLEQTRRWREQSIGQQVLAHHAPWNVDIDADNGAQLLARVRALELLVERIAMSTDHGDLELDHLDWIEVASLCEAALTASMKADYARSELGALVAVFDGHRAGVGLEDAPRVDLNAHHQARAAHQLRPGRHDPREMTRDALELGTGPNPFVGLDGTVMESDWLDVDRALLDATGTNLEAVGALLGTAVSWDVDANEPVALVERADLIGEAALWSHLPIERIRAAVQLLTFDAERAAQLPFDYWRLEQRPQRLTTRPFARLEGDRIWVLPETVHAAQKLILTCMDDGRLPWPDLPEPVLAALRRLRLRCNRDHERHVVEVCREAGLTVWPGLQPRKARARGVDWPDRVGEFDVFAADPHRGRLWVLEAKHPVNAVSSWHLRDAISGFHTRDGHIDKLERRWRAVADDPSAAGTLLRFEPRSWDVHTAMVTREVESAAFTLDPRVCFVVVDDLADLLTTTEPILPGHWRIGVA